MGALAFGSGAMSVNAAFTNSVSPDNNMQIIAAVDIDVRKGNNVPASGASTITDGNANSLDVINLDNPDGDSRVASGSLDFANLTGEDVPVAGVNDGENGSLIIETATPIRPSASTPLIWEELVELQNNGDATVSGVGIEFSTYGGDVDGTDLTQEDVQEVYQFIEKSSGTQISPLSGDSSEAPANTISVDPGTTEQLNIEDHAYNYTSVLRQKSSATGGNPWTGSADNISLLDQITVGSN